MTKTTININMDDEVAQALKHVSPYLQKAVEAKQESLRLSTASVFYLFHYAMKCKALAQIKKDEKPKPALEPNALRDALKRCRDSLQKDGCTNDTVWMDAGNETMFEFIEEILERDANQNQMELPIAEDKADV